MITPNFARGSIDDSSVIEISSSDDEEEVVNLTSSADELHKKTPKNIVHSKGTFVDETTSDQILIPSPAYDKRAVSCHTLCD